MQYLEQIARRTESFVRIQGQAFQPKGCARHLVDTQRFKSKPMAMPAASTMKNTVGD